MCNDFVSASPTPLDETDRRLLDALQQSIPLVDRPFGTIGKQLGLTEADVITRLQRIRSQGLISRIAAIFDTRSLGYESVLVAAKYAPADLDHAAAIINEHPGVSHNYQRTADYNLWFTLAVPPDSRLGLEGTAAKLAERTGAQDYRLLPADRVFKIGVRLALSDEDTDRQAANSPQSPAAATCHASEAPLQITPAVKAAILALQEDLPAEPRPFDHLATAHGLEVHHLLATAVDLLDAGVMRRYAAVLRHRKVGFAVNCMTVWNAPADRAEQVGQTLAEFPEVTHCYLRPTWPGWSHNLYAMVHCRSDEQCQDLIRRMKAATGLTDMLAVYSTKEYKKVRLQYFSPAFAEWEDQHAQTRQ